MPKKKKKKMTSVFSFYKWFKKTLKSFFLCLFFSYFILFFFQFVVDSRKVPVAVKRSCCNGEDEEKIFLKFQGHTCYFWPFVIRPL